MKLTDSCRNHSSVCLAVALLILVPGCNQKTGEPTNTIDSTHAAGSDLTQERKAELERTAELEQQRKEELEQQRKEKKIPVSTDAEIGEEARTCLKTVLE